MKTDEAMTALLFLFQVLEYLKSIKGPSTLNEPQK